MMDNNILANEELLLREEDFPDDYIQMAHPDDYKLTTEFLPRFVYHSHYGRHDRLIARVAWKASEDVVIPMSFVCDTGAPSHLYLSQEAIRVLDQAKLLLKDDRDTPYVMIHVNDDLRFPATVDETPSVHKHANILGLKSLKRLELFLKGDNFNFNSGFKYL